MRLEAKGDHDGLVEAMEAVGRYVAAYGFGGLYDGSYKQANAERHAKWRAPTTGDATAHAQHAVRGNGSYYFRLLDR